MSKKLPKGIRQVTTKAGKTRYRVVVDIGYDSAGKRQQVTRTFDTLTEAKREQKILRGAAAEGGRLQFSDATTVGKLIDAWLASRDDVRPVTVEGYKNSLAYVTREKRPFTLGGRPFRDWQVQKVEMQHIETLKRWMVREGGQHGQGLGTSSVKHTLVALRQVFDYAVSAHIIRSNPMENVKAPRKAGGSRKAGVGVAYWTPSEARTFASHVESDRLNAAWRLTLCGLRRSEVLGLTWDAIDWDTGEVAVQQGRVAVTQTQTAIDDVKRGDSDRLVPVDTLWPGTTDSLRRLRTQVRSEALVLGETISDSDLVVVNEIGEPVRPEWFSDRFKRLSVEAGVSRIRLHATRHTLGHMMGAAGVAPADGARILGHSTEVYLSTYSKSTSAGVHAAAERVAAVLHA